MSEVNMDGIDAKLARLSGRVLASVGEALTAGFEAAIEATPEDTSFMRASWYMTANGIPGAHPNPPDFGFKQTLAPGSGRQSAFTNIYEAASDNAAANIGFSRFGARDAGGRFTSAAGRIRVIAFINDAPYADDYIAESGYQFDEAARSSASDAIHASFARSGV